MPELPEVETTLRGIAPHLVGLHIRAIIIRQAQLRWPIPNNLEQHLLHKHLLGITRRAKYLLLEFESGVLLIHLGMSGNLRLVSSAETVNKHDHVDLIFNRQQVLRFTDPRRFGSVLWLGKEPEQHALIKKLGPEPLSHAFTGKHLYNISRNRKIAIKQLLMDQTIVTGIGNIYANEALFKAAIRPTRAAGRISLTRYQNLTEQIKSTLEIAIKQGGTTLKDFVGGDGKPGYFQQQLHVYGRANEACTQCGKNLKEIRLAGRSTVYCCYCQR